MIQLHRRTFLHSSLAAVATTLTAASFSPAAPASTQFIDVNVSLARWPFRSLNGDTPSALAAQLRKNGVTQAWCGSFDGILQKDIAAMNARLTKDCQEFGPGLLVPVGSINPTLPGWRSDLTRCVTDHGMKAIRLHPNYHGYKLTDPAFLDLLAEATRQKLLVQIVAQLEDQRTQHPLVQVAPVDLKPLASALKATPHARVMVLNANRAMSMTALQGLPVWIDIAMLEGVAGIEGLLKDWPADKLVFGSHAPFFYWESAKLKLEESDLTAAQLTAITHGNALL